MKVLITGAAGFIGSHLARYCKEQGDIVYIIDKDYSKHKMEDFEMKWTVDVAKPGTDLNMIFGSYKPDVCYHLAAYASESRSNHIRSFIHYNNTVATANIINQCVQHGVMLVFTSSVAVFSGDGPFDDDHRPDPIDSYGISKYTSEQEIKIANKTQLLNYAIVRPRNVYGPGQNMWDPSRNLFGIWMYNVMNGKPCYIYGDGKQRRNFTFIEDLIPPLYRARDMHYKGYSMCVNLGSNIAYSINEAADAFTAVTGFSDFKHIGARHEVSEALCGTGRSEHFLKWSNERQTSLRAGLTCMWEWAKRQPDRPLDEMPKLETTINAHQSLK